MEFKLKTLTPIWTGGVEGKCDRLHETGIIGSLRWWYEALVRGLGGYACDPTSDERCQLNQEKFHKAIKRGKTVQEALDEQICPACQLFGCTGWGRKFIFRIQAPDGKPIPGRLEKDTNFNLIFIEKKKFTPLEKLLLKKTIKLIVEYGALGAKIALKPSEISNKNLPSYSKRNHLDYGIITYQDGYKIDKTEDVVLKKPSDKENQLDWPNLKYFWFIPRDYLNREQINQLVNRNNKGWYQNPDKFQVFLGGCIRREKCCPEGIERMSKKIFSFHGKGSNDPQKTRRCFGYVRNSEELEEIKQLIWAQLKKKIEILTWENIKNVL